MREFDQRLTEEITREAIEETSLSDEERFERNYFLRQLVLLHELGHCDLKREEEERATTSIMNAKVILDIQNRIRDEYLNIALDSLLSDSLIAELFTQRIHSFPFYLILPPSVELTVSEKKIEVTRRVQRYIEELIMTTNLYDL